MISDEALEAAAKAIEREFSYDENAAYMARLALEAAAPYMLREAKSAGWAVGYKTGREDESSTQVPFATHTQTTNPYRSQA